MSRANPEWMVLKRNGESVPFVRGRIEQAISAAFRAELDLGTEIPLDSILATEIGRVADGIISEASFQARDSRPVSVEHIQDLVEQQLMRAGHYNVARRYIVYRQEHATARALRGEASGQAVAPKIRLKEANGDLRPLEAGPIKRRMYEACRNLPHGRPEDLLQDVFGSLYDLISSQEVSWALVLAARSRIEREPAFSQVAGRLLLGVIYEEALALETDPAATGRPLLEETYRSTFAGNLKRGVEASLLDARLLDYDLARLAQALRPGRDEDFEYLGLQTLYDRYLIHISGRRIEAPQQFWMRIAMGLGLAEKPEDREARAVEFYEILSTLRFVSATPTLFNSGTRHPQLSSCYLSTTMDDLGHIFKVVSDNAKLSKWAGGLGNDWTSIRATGSHIKGTNGASQGVIPFLKIVSDTAVAVNQGGKRKGAVCAYLEPWHLDVEDFLELRKNTGDERRRTHDMHTANWIPDLFMKRVAAGGHWTLFSPEEVPDLHDLYGRAFETRYQAYEEMAQAGKIQLWKRVEAKVLWRKMLSMLFETGHPWITFKDPSNIRSPQDHAGVVHSSNLCTEILLNTSADETAVCNLGSVNLAAHITDAGLDEARLATTIRTAVRMLDNVIDINFYPTPEAHRSNLMHRPVGLGIMGFQDALFVQRIPYASPEAVEFADWSMELVSYHALTASSDLAQERGTYPSYTGSKWSRGLLPLDTVALLEQERGEPLEVDRTARLDWGPVRQKIRRQGMRNSNVMAIAPTATIANIAGVTASIEPVYRNLYAKSNLSGDFTVVNRYLVQDLRKLDLWDDHMMEDLKHFDGSVQEIDRVPQTLKDLYRTAMEIQPQWLIECGSRRQKWLDMGQSLNLYIDRPDGKLLDQMYFLAWRMGLKTTYYLRSVAATQIEKSSIDVHKHGMQPRWMKHASATGRVRTTRLETELGSSGPGAGLEDPGIPQVQAGPGSTDSVDGKAALQATAALATAATAATAAVGADPGPDPGTLDGPLGPKACSLEDPDCEACQ